MTDLLLLAVLLGCFSRFAARSVFRLPGGLSGGRSGGRGHFADLIRGNPLPRRWVPSKPLEAEIVLVGHRLPAIFLAQLVLPGLHLGGRYAFRDPPEPDTVGVEFHP